MTLDEVRQIFPDLIDGVHEVLDNMFQVNIHAKNDPGVPWNVRHGRVIPMDQLNPRDYDEISLKVNVYGREVLIDKHDFSLAAELIAFCTPEGYVQIRTNGTTNTGYHSLHRWLMNCPKGKEVDHINNKPWDNRRSNLRVCTKDQNLSNRRVFKNSQTGYKGVKKLSDGTFEAVVNYRESVGVFSTAEDAHQAWATRAKELQGDYFNDGSRDDDE